MATSPPLEAQCASGARWTATGWIRGILPGLAIFILGLLAYANSFPGDFFIDDVYIVAENPLLDSLDLRTIFTTDYWGQGANRSGVFRPLTILSFAINKRLLGPEPWSYHLINVILHALVGVGLFLLLRRWELSLGQAFVAAMLFALHPIHTEVVNEAVGRSELLVALFYLLGLYLAATSGPWSLALSGLCFVLALLAKEHAITFLAALVLRDLFVRKASLPRLPFYLSLLGITGTWLLYRSYGLEYGATDPFQNSSQINAIYQPLALIATPVRILTALKIQLLYLGKLLLPFNLQAVYSGPAVSSPVASLFSGWGALITVAVIGLTALTLYGWRRRQPFGLAIPLYVTGFSVTANLFFVSGVVMAERVAYLPSAWFCMGFAALLPGMAPRKTGVQRTMAALLILLGTGAGLATWARNHDYGDQVRLWSKDFQRDPGNIIAGTYLIDAFIQKEEYANAAAVGEQILTLHPTLPESLEMQAWLLVRVDKPGEALIYAEKAIRQMKDAPSQGLLTTLVEINLQLRRPAEVLKWLELQEDSARVGYYWELKGNAYEELGQYRQAVDAYRRIGEPPPESDVPYRLERLLGMLGEHAEAAEVRQWIRFRENELGKGHE